MIFDYSNIHILHAEDELADARVMKHILTKIGFNGHYELRRTSDEVLDYFTLNENKLPTIILLDIGLPGITGLELLEKLRENTKSKFIPIVMLSGSSSLRDYQQSIALGANAYLIKSSELAELSVMIESLIKSWGLIARQQFF